MSMQALRERLSAINKEAKNLLESKGSTTWLKEDQAKFDNLMDEAERATRQLEAHQRVLNQEADDVTKNPPKNEPGNPKTELMKGLEIYMRKSARDMSQEEAIMVRNTMSTTTSSEGGATVQPIVASSLIDLLKAYGFIRRVAAQISTANGVDMNYPTSDGTSEIGEIIAQNTVATALDASFSTRALNTFKFGSKVITVPIELLQDSSIDVVAMVQRRLRDRIGRIQNTKFTIGTGTGEPFGLSAVAGVGKVGTTGQTLTVIYDDLVDLIDSLDAAYLDNPPSEPQMPSAAPGWMFSQTMRRVVRKIKDTAGRPIWTPSYDEGMSSKTPDLLLGYPVNINNDMPVPAANAKSMAFGNLNKYMIRDAMEVTMFRFEDSVYMTKGQVGFMAWSRAGGNLMDINSVKQYQHSAT
jgi:HK97 family phage major capsid protein